MQRRLYISIILLLVCTIALTSVLPFAISYNNNLIKDNGINVYVDSANINTDSYFSIVHNDIEKVIKLLIFSSFITIKESILYKCILSLFYNYLNFYQDLRSNIMISVCSHFYGSKYKGIQEINL